MKNLFRKFRLQLTANKKLRGYLVYAVGEIILVVAGILIALALNNWNNNRIESNQKERLLRKLVVDLDNDIERITFLENHGDLGMVNKIQVDSLLEIIARGIEMDDLDFLTSKNPIFNVFNYNLQNTTYEEMTNTGKLYSIGTDTLISSIQKYYKLCEREQYYNLTWGNRVEQLGEKCSSGWEDFLYLYKVDLDEAIKVHSWIFDTKSLNYINLRRYVWESSLESGYTQDRFERIRNQSKDLKSLVENEIKIFSG